MSGEESVPCYASGVRLRHDTVRDAWVVLAPERLFVPDPHALEVLKLVDGKRNVAAIIDDLALRFDAPRALIATDVSALLDDLAGKGAIRL